MQPTIMNANRPPYARFELRPVEDREASLKNKYYTTKDVAYALVTPSGSRDVVEKLADEWFEQLEQFVREERFPPHWLQYYRDQYDNWKRGIEPTINGTDIRNWPIASPSQANTLRQLGVRSVEDLAELNEEGLSRLGMGGRQLREQAQAWVANSTGKAVEAERAAKEAQEQVKALQAQIDALTGAKAAAQPPSPPAATTATKL